jgi:hypothetical protein
MSADADDHRRWREIGDAIRTLNATYDGPPPMAEITRIAEKHQAKPSDVLMMQRTHRTKGQIEYPDDKSPHIRPRPVDLAGLDHIDDLTHEAPDGTAADGRSMQVTCDRCGRQVSAAGIHAHQRGNRCIPPETAEPDTTVQASAPPAVAEDEPTPPADPVVIDVQWPQHHDPADYPSLHDVAAGIAPLVEDDEPAPGWEQQLFEPLTEDERAQASDMALVSDALLAMSMLGDQIPDVLRTQHGLALNHVTALHKALGDHHRNADLLAERAVLAARLAEIDQALAPVHDTEDHREAEPAADPQTVTCECGAVCKPAGLAIHRARSARHTAWAAQAQVQADYEDGAA